MQTRRDQLQAYRFQNRRALAALVTGEPNVLEPPMRRLTVTTLSGIMIAILIAAGFAAVGIIHPSAGDDWKNPHAVIVDRDNNSSYVYIRRTLYPVVNFTSGVLAVSNTGSGGSGGAVGRVEVSSDDISGATYGREIGIPDVPSALPSAKSLVNFPMSVCSTQQKVRDASNQFDATVSLRIHSSAAGSTKVAASHGVLVQASGPTPFLLTHGERLALTSQNIAGQLGFNTPPVKVGTAFLDSIPLGPDLSAPVIPGHGSLSSYAVGSTERPIGQVLRTTDTGQSFIVLRGGLQQLTPVEAALFVDSSVPLAVKSSDVDSAQKAGLNVLNPITELGRVLPSVKPVNDDQSGDRSGACAVFDSATGRPRFTLTGNQSTSGTSNPVVIDTSKSGQADRVSISATAGVLATPANDPHTIVVISDQGVQYPFADADLLASFGYSRKDVVQMPAALLRLIPTGTGLSTAAALHTIKR